MAIAMAAYKYARKVADMGCCGNRPAATPDAPPSDWVLLNYIGTSPTPLRFRSNDTGLVYRAGRDYGYNHVYVHPADVNLLTKTMKVFEVVSVESKAEATEDDGTTDEPKAKRGKK